MLRLSPPSGSTLERAVQLNVNVAGAESNVAISASRMGLSTGWISRLPESPLGRLVSSTIASQGVDISRVVWTAQGRVGTYYLELANAPRANRVIYDRAGSAVTQMTPEDIDWEYVTSARIVHLTGITPALSPSCAAIIKRTIEIAQTKGTLISFDVNYRGKLWSSNEAAAALDPLLNGIHILRAGADEARLIFGLQGSTEQVIRALWARYQPKIVVVTDGAEPALAFDGTTLHERPCHPVSIVDEIGAGDAFMAGFLVGYLENGIAHGLEFGQALAALKMTFAGDLAWCSRGEVEALISKQAPNWR
jgi:2-dehydro-3-deoxygluconokinase